MARSRTSLLALALAATALILGACGDDDDDGGSDDEAQITEAIERSATSGDPAACTDAQTQRFTEQVSGGETGEAAVTQCEEDAADTVADEVEVENLEVDGDAATADVAITGSVFDGQTLSVALVQEGDQWKLDELTGFAEFDRAACEASFREELASAEEVPPQAVDCVLKQFGQLSDQQIQDFFLGRADSAAEDQIFGPCFGGE